MPYRPDVLEQLARHGVRPLPSTPPALVREFVYDLYRYEIRRLRARLLEGELQKRDYARHVTELRRRYPVLSLPVALWMEQDETGLTA